MVLSSPKIILASVLMGISLMAYSRVSAFLFADDTDGETSVIAGKLDFSLWADMDFLPHLRPGTTTRRQIILVPTTTAEIGYTVRTENASGSLCPNLILNFTDLAASVSASESLIGFSATTTFESSEPRTLVFTASLLDSGQAWQNQDCAFDFVFDAWQAGIGPGQGGFTDRETIANLVQTGNEPTQPESPAPGEIVINEIMWMGSQIGNDDQWIELRNTAPRNLSLGGLKLENVLNNRGSVKFPQSAVIPGHGYYLIARYHASHPRSFLAVDPDLVHSNLRLKASGNGNIILRGADGTVIDAAAGDVWPAGKNVLIWQAMERDFIPADGLNPDSWHTACAESANDLVFWDREDLTFGTPNQENSACHDTTHPGASPTDVRTESSSVQPSAAVEENPAMGDVENIGPDEKSAPAQDDAVVVVMDIISEESLVEVLFPDETLPSSIFELAEAGQ